MNVHLISWTQDPIGTALRIWDASRTPEYADVKERGYLVPVWDGPSHTTFKGTEAEYEEEDLALFRNLLQLNLPVMENVVFNFVLEDVPIAWREQAVRHRIGVHYGDNFGVDIVPDAGTGISFWSQTMRVMDMSNFHDEERYWIPDSILQDPRACKIYMEAMGNIQAAYRNLLDLGIPKEDARGVIPLHATHNISMTINLRSMQNIIGKRGCWISQSNLWMPVIKGMVNQLAEKIHPVFRELVYPPCIEGGKFVGCKFEHECERRMDQTDRMPICPLYLTRHADEQERQAAIEAGATEGMHPRLSEYAELWDQPQLPETWEWEEKNYA